MRLAIKLEPSQKQGNGKDDRDSTMNGHDARIVANWFIERAAKETEDSKRALTIMKLLKLIYIAHGWHLECTGKPLIRNRIEAWRYGPVIPSVYKAYRPQGVKISKIAEVESRAASSLDDEQASLLEEVYSVYGNMDGVKLSKLTHAKGGPWAITYRFRGQFAPIDDIFIKRHYQSIREGIENAKKNTEK